MTEKIKAILIAVDALTAELDCGHAASEQILTNFEQELKSFSEGERNQIRRKMIFLVAQLSRLEVRFMTTDGPLRGPI